MSSGKPTAKQVTLTGQQMVDMAAQLTPYDSNCNGFETTVPSPSIESSPTQLTRMIEEGEGARSPRILTSAPAESEFLLAGEPVTVSIPIPVEDQTRIQNLVRDGVTPGSFLLTVAGVATDKSNAAAYGIYVGLPQGVVPNDRNDYFAAYLSFFGIGHHHHDDESQMAAMGQDLTFNITDEVRRLVTRGELGNTLSITFANTAALEPNLAQAPAAPADTQSPRGAVVVAPAEARARFTYLKLIVQ